MFNRLFAFFGNFGVRYFSRWLDPLKEEIIRSNLTILFEIYVGRMIALAVLAFICSLVSITLLFTFYGFPLFFSLLSSVIAGVTAAVVILTLFHSYPFHLISSKKKSIESNHPFAINHMAAIAGSGVPPFVIFKLLANVPEYGEVSNECKRIVRNVDKFGMDMISAIKNVADRTPSEEFRQFFYGLIATIDTGGDMRTYLDNSAKDAIFGYRLKRERYMQTLSTYADFYTAVLIAAPLFFVSVLSVMSMIGGDIFGLSIPTIMNLGIYGLIPILNTGFILFVHYTQPSI
jgi:archaeal flagellar protein FlaJ